MRKSFCLALLIALSATASAQQMNESEVIVTSSRSDADDYESLPLIGLTRTADFAVQYVTVTGDTREADKRRDEIFAMVRGAIQLAARRGDVELATGQLVVEPLNLDNYRNLPLHNDGRPDSERTAFL